MHPYIPSMIELAKKYIDKWHWFFVGPAPESAYDFLEHVPNAQETGARPLLEFYAALFDINPSIVYVPLLFNDFNTSKSCLGLLDAVGSGAACLGPDLPEWHVPGVALYKTPDEFKEKFEMLIKDKEKRVKNFYLSRDYIQDNLLLSKANFTRIQLINERLK
jgi:hypothetical protein